MKNKRQEMILKLVAENEVTTQEELCEALRLHGFEAAQATVSRDIKELALIKTSEENGKSRYALPQLKKQAMDENGGLIFKIISDSVKAIDHASNIVVIKCAAGMAQAICSKLDSTNIHSVVGTIAGDDTIFILMRTERDAERLSIELTNILENR